jgi:hypothetical protein
MKICSVLDHSIYITRYEPIPYCVRDNKLSLQQSIRMVNNTISNQPISTVKLDHNLILQISCIPRNNDPVSQNNSYTSSYSHSSNRYDNWQLTH